MACICHVATQGRQETVLRLATAGRIEKLLEFAEKWADLDKEPEMKI